MPVLRVSETGCFERQDFFLGKKILTSAEPSCKKLSEYPLNSFKEILRNSQLNIDSAAI